MFYSLNIFDFLKAGPQKHQFQTGPLCEKGCRPLLYPQTGFGVIAAAELKNAERDICRVVIITNPVIWLNIGVVTINLFSIVNF